MAPRKTNRQILEDLGGQIDSVNANLADRIDGSNERIDSSNERTDSLHGRFDDLRDDINKQFDNHLSTHDKLNKRLFKGGLVLIALIVLAVGFNNLPAIIRVVTAMIKWI